MPNYGSYSRSDGYYGNNFDTARIRNGFGDNNYNSWAQFNNNNPTFSSSYRSAERSTEAFLAESRATLREIENTRRELEAHQQAREDFVNRMTNVRSNRYYPPADAYTANGTSNNAYSSYVNSNNGYAEQGVSRTDSYEGEDHATQQLHDIRQRLGNTSLRGQVYPSSSYDVYPFSTANSNTSALNSGRVGDILANPGRYSSDLISALADLFHQGLMDHNDADTTISVTLSSSSNISSNSYPRNFKDLVRNIYQSAGQRFNQEQWESLERQNNDHVDDFQKFIQEVYQNGRATPAEIVNVLDAVVDDQELRNQLFAYASGELENCHDRRLLAFNDIQALAEVSRLKKSDLPNSAQALVKICLGSLRQSRLKEFISQKLAQQGRSGNEALELEMALRKKLGEMLELPFPVHNMVYESFADTVFPEFLTEEGLAEAVSFVLNAENDPSVVVEDLLNYIDPYGNQEDPTLLSYLKNKYEKTDEMSSLREPFYNDLEIMGDRLTASQAGTSLDRTALEQEKAITERQLAQNALSAAGSPIRALRLKGETDQLQAKLVEINTKLQSIAPYTEDQYNADIKRINEEKEESERGFYKAIILSLL